MKKRLIVIGFLTVASISVASFAEAYDRLEDGETDAKVSAEIGTTLSPEVESKLNPMVDAPITVRLRYGKGGSPVGNYVIRLFDANGRKIINLKGELNRKETVIRIADSSKDFSAGKIFPEVIGDSSDYEVTVFQGDQPVASQNLEHITGMFYFGRFKVTSARDGGAHTGE